MKRFLCISLLCLIASIALGQASQGIIPNSAAMDSLYVRFIRARDSLANYVVYKSTPHLIYDGSLIDSVKTSDTVHLARISASTAIDTLTYYSARGASLTVRIEMVDSLYQTTGNIVLVDTCTVVNQLTRKTAACAGGTFTLTPGKGLRMVFPVVGVMPKQFGSAVAGH